MMITLLVELFLIGYLLFLDEWIYATLVAAAIGLLITPILAIALYIPSSLSNTAKIIKTIIAFVIGLAVVGVCLALIIVQTDDADQEDNDNWVYAFLVLLPIELIVAESLKTAVKYGFIKILGDSCGGILKDF
mmetsp:Transcript_26169/g.4496  ORF Transcript_26169/g.4496 Transcript_26169/m.4496 type:complete len:133 (+) Transcript_26169:3446-3844(+)